MFEALNSCPHNSSVIAATLRALAPCTYIRAGPRLALVLCLALSPGGQAPAADSVLYTRAEDVIYGRKYGTALTLDVLVPKGKTNGLGVIRVVSGGWSSSHEAVDPDWVADLLRRGYKVFVVVHGSPPKFDIPEIVEDLHRAVRFIRHNGAKWRIAPDRLGIMGGSAAGHLSLVVSLAGRPGVPEAKDPVDRESSRVQAVACFFPPTDFLNYGEPGRDVFKALESELSDLRAPFDFQEFDPQTRCFRRISDPERRLAIAKEISPVTYVTPNAPPTLLIHGDADNIVPLQQSRILEQKLRAAGVPVKLVIKPGAGHGWPGIRDDVATIGDWFDQHLLGRKP